MSTPAPDTPDGDAELARATSLIGPLLDVHMHGRHVAQLHSPREGRAKLTYLPDAAAVTRGLSCSLPAAGGAYSGKSVTNWLAGLLPDRSDELVRWRAKYGVRRQDAYGLLWHVGEDVAGAASFRRPQVASQTSALEPLSEECIGARIAALSGSGASWSPGIGAGKFSLAGAQAKFALALTDSGWAEPSGERATTHIFKPAIPDLPDQDLNEHITMRLAAAAGLPVASTQLVSFSGSRTLIVARFDRYWAPDGVLRRVHQEDMVQALGQPPALKYEEAGGPGARQIVGLLRRFVTGDNMSRDIDVFIDALAFNWLVLGTDAHARNYALMHHGTKTRLAPLYDLNTFLPYTDGTDKKLAMRIGFTNFSALGIGGRDWEELSRDCGLESDYVLARVSRVGTTLQSVASRVLQAPEVAEWESPLPRLLGDLLAKRLSDCLARL